jgi:exopolysaccharide biosynthesis polyprenyl glycosylphosphotransferase
MENRKDFAPFISRLLVDSIVIVSSWMLAFYLRFAIIPGGRGFPALFFLKLSFLIMFVTIFFIRKNGLYHSMRNYTWIQEVQRIAFSSAESVAAAAFIFYFFFPDRISRLSIALYGLIVMVLLVIERILISHIIGRSRSQGKNVKRVLLVGFGDAMKRYYEQIQESSALGLRVLAQVDGNDGALPGIPQSGKDLTDAVQFFKPDIIAVSYPLGYEQKAQQQLDRCAELFAEVLYIPSMRLSTLGTTISDYYNIPVVHINHVNFSHFDRIAKRALDLFGSIVGLILLSPLFLIIAVVIKLTSKGPVFYSQERVTVNEKLFKMVKFRTMKNSSSSSQLKWTQKNDPRVTGIGKFLRMTSLDELPQLWNVLTGEMSLIGPRPERKEFVEQFNEQIPGYRLRHKMNAGMSGWAQVNGLRGDTSIEKRIDSDLYYIRHWSILFDIRIILLTFVKGFINKNAY